MGAIIRENPDCRQKQVESTRLRYITHLHSWTAVVQPILFCLFNPVRIFAFHTT